MRLINDNEWFNRTKSSKWRIKLIIKQTNIISVS
ncbi:hypothetical protein HmCmsJML099_04812 [Escherichia coli]|nr:hypothetical protein HmCmsJML099_04812 [Escherichia coli]